MIEKNYGNNLTEETEGLETAVSKTNKELADGERKELKQKGIEDDEVTYKRKEKFLTVKPRSRREKLEAQLRRILYGVGSV